MTTVERSAHETAYEWIDPDAGAYVDSETYHRDHDKIGNSAKERHIEAPRLYEAEYVTHTATRKVTKDLRIGIYSHLCLFENDVWRARYVCEPAYELDGRSTAGKALRAEFAVQSIGKTVVKREEYELVERIVAAVWANELVAGLLREEGPTERPIVWQDADTGLWLKNKQDKFITARNWILDLKTKTGSVKPEATKSEIQKRGLHRNADFYIRGHLALTGDQAEYLFLFVSKTTFEVSAVHLRDDWLADGYLENQKALRAMARARETGIYLAEHETQVTLLAPPAWKPQLPEEDEAEDGEEEA
jgi:hypothetical protein